MRIIKRLLIVALVAISGIAVAATPASAAFVDYELKSHWYWPNKCLDMDINGPGNGSKVQLWTCNGEPQQGWYWGNTYHGFAELRNTRTGRCLDLDLNTIGNGAYMQVWDCYGADQHNQHWRVEQQSGNPNAFRFINEKGYCLDVDWNGPYFDGKRVQAWSCHWYDNQVWEPVAHSH
jgi:Ricin-type beta-trefoil lectin domain